MKVMVIVKATKASEAGEMPSQQLLTDMGQLQRGTGQGRHPARRGWAAPLEEGRAGALLRQGPHGHRRPVRGDQGADRRATGCGRSGPRWRAIAWVKRCPNPHDEACEIEIRPVFEADDFGEALDAGVARAGGAHHGRRQAQRRA